MITIFSQVNIVLTANILLVSLYLRDVTFLSDYFISK